MVKVAEMMRTKKQSHCWWFDSHNSPRRSPWLQSTLAGISKLLVWMNRKFLKFQNNWLLNSLWDLWLSVHLCHCSIWNICNISFCLVSYIIFQFEIDPQVNQTWIDWLLPTYHYRADYYLPLTKQYIDTAKIL